jgi:hypothetical protein
LRQGLPGSEGIFTTQAAVFEQQIMQKIGQLTPVQKQTVYEFVDFLLSKQAQQPAARRAALLQVSVWDEQAIQEIQAAQQRINAWQPPGF